MSSVIAEGACGCGEVVFHTCREPLIIHACHCRHCQRQTGTSHAINALIEHNQIDLISGGLVSSRVDTASGAGQTIVRCRRCFTALWSHYHRFPFNRGDLVSFVRVGTLNQAYLHPPDVHIYTNTMFPQFMPAPDVPLFEEFYDIKQLWPEESLSRLKKLLSNLDAKNTSCSQQEDIS